jgi:hypothetical protein
VRVPHAQECAHGQTERASQQGGSPPKEWGHVGQLQLWKAEIPYTAVTDQAQIKHRLERAYVDCSQSNHLQGTGTSRVDRRRNTHQSWMNCCCTLAPHCWLSSEGCHRKKMGGSAARQGGCGKVLLQVVACEGAKVVVEPMYPVGTLQLLELRFLR